MMPLAFVNKGNSYDKTRQLRISKKEAEGLDFQLYPGDIGQRIFNGISKEAWKLWQGKQTMLINEHKLNLMEPSARNF